MCGTKFSQKVLGGAASSDLGPRSQERNSSPLFPLFPVPPRPPRAT